MAPVDSALQLNGLPTCLSCHYSSVPKKLQMCRTIKQCPEGPAVDLQSVPTEIELEGINHSLHKYCSGMCWSGGVMAQHKMWLA